MIRRTRSVPLPSVGDVEREIARVSRRSGRRRAARAAAGVLITVAASAVLIATLLLPVLKICGSSMSPTLKEGTVAAALKPVKIRTGDVIAFHFGGKILIKRVIAGPGSRVDIAEDGTVSVDGRTLEEPYVTGKARGDRTAGLPCQVPDGCLFVMGDHRDVSVDSRSAAVGCVAEESVVGRLVFTIWPFEEIGVIR